MTALEQKQADRLKFLNRLYEETEGYKHAHVSMWQIGKDLEFTEEQTQNTVAYLEGENLMEHQILGGGIGITHFGIQQVEAALSRPKEATQYFPPAVNIINVQNMNNSAIQQASHSSTQNNTVTTANMDDLKTFLENLTQTLPSLDLSDSDKEQAVAQIATVETQLKAPKPVHAVIQAAGNALHAILLGVAGNYATDLSKMLGAFG